MRTGQGLPWSAERCPVFPETVLDFHSKLGGLGTGRQNGDLSPGGSEQGCGYGRVLSVRATQAWPWWAGPFLLGNQAGLAPHLSNSWAHSSVWPLGKGLMLGLVALDDSPCRLSGPPPPASLSSHIWPGDSQVRIFSGQMPVGTGLGWAMPLALSFIYSLGQVVSSFWPQFYHL